MKMVNKKRDNTTKSKNTNAKKMQDNIKMEKAIN
jgi:hypothetical protein